MRRNRWAAALAAAALLAGLCGCGGERAPDQRHTVALVAKSTQTEFWLSVFAGAQAAAAEYNVALTTMGPDTEEDYEEKEVYVPDLTGYTLEEANETLAELGLNLRPLGGAAQKAGAECSGVMNYKEVYVKKGTIIEAYFLINDETG